MPLCRATTRAGTPCKLAAGDSGYCHIHDPDRQARSKQKQQLLASQASQRKQRLTQPSFGRRMGYVSVAQELLLGQVTRGLRTALWNVIYKMQFQQYCGSWGGWDLSTMVPRPPSLELVWTSVLKSPLHLIPGNTAEAVAAIHDFMQGCEWFLVYDLVELVLNLCDDPGLTEAVNDVLEREMSAYRFVGGVITQITDALEIHALQEALDDVDFPLVRTHLRRALELMSDREKPDYRNSVKESISAVERFAKTITGQPNATLGQALKFVERANPGMVVPASLLQAYSNLYGYACSEDGIRHALMDETNLTVPEAKYFLIACTAFINYLKAKLPA